MLKHIKSIIQNIQIFELSTRIVSVLPILNYSLLKTAALCVYIRSDLLTHREHYGDSNVISFCAKGSARAPQRIQLSTTVWRNIVQ